MRQASATIARRLRSALLAFGAIVLLLTPASAHSMYSAKADNAASRSVADQSIPLPHNPYVAPAAGMAAELRSLPAPCCPVGSGRSPGNTCCAAGCYTAALMARPDAHPSDPHALGRTVLHPLPPLTIGHGIATSPSTPPPR